MTRLKLALVALFFAFGFGCEDATRPEEPVWNKQPCDHCHMLLSDPRYAAQLTTKAGRRLYFDDVGCLAATLQHEPNIVRAFVHTAAGWQDAFTARYSADASTPMGFGFVADAHGPNDFATVRRSVSAALAQKETP